MRYKVSHSSKKLKGVINLTASKSESNRVLIIQAICDEDFGINNLAEAQDTQTLQKILETEIVNPQSVYDVGAAGTTIRFLTAYFSTVPGTRTLTGSDRMKKRPIRALVDALRQLGAKIEYLESEGYPPLRITGTALKGNEATLDPSISSQFITALLLIAPKLPHGLTIRFEGGKPVSHPYITMTLKIMEHFGVYGQYQDDCISVSTQKYSVQESDSSMYLVEGDWSAVSYWYAMAALAAEVDLTIRGLKEESLQGDSVLKQLFEFFGVHTEFTKDGIRLRKEKVNAETFAYNFSDCPDIAQTLAVVVSALGIPSMFNGLDTLTLKETNRLQALKNELAKMNTSVEIISNSIIEIKPGKKGSMPDAPIKTYEDHRMAMSFAPLALLGDSVEIEDPEVVKKSYPNFWNDLRSTGFTVEEIA
ncbi:MAG TPA: 3-phosphoshikimate 1-carboxyvinyltransferase [Bacteroidia bacterium]|jgi:3-phosphoshikimate 1-carboxyvinyltransferase|nr:3-phosphoshikimate 1-carboxyvinyltransferase [Bacteroidia bacterium]